MSIATLSLIEVAFLEDVAIMLSAVGALLEDVVVLLLADVAFMEDVAFMLLDDFASREDVEDADLALADLICERRAVRFDCLWRRPVRCSLVSNAMHSGRTFVIASISP